MLWTRKWRSVTAILLRSLYRIALRDQGMDGFFPWEPDTHTHSITTTTNSNKTQHEVFLGPPKGTGGVCGDGDGGRLRKGPEGEASRAPLLFFSAAQQLKTHGFLHENTIRSACDSPLPSPCPGVQLSGRAHKFVWFFFFTPVLKYLKLKRQQVLHGIKTRQRKKDHRHPKS